MKVNFTEAAQNLKLHPCDLVLRLTVLGDSFEEVFPAVSRELIESVRQMHSRAEEAHTEVSELTSVSRKSVSQDAAILLREIERKGYWGTHVVPEDVLLKHYCHNLERPKKALKELQKLGLVKRGRRKRTVSLDPSRKADISRILDESGF